MWDVLYVNVWRRCGLCVGEWLLFEACAVQIRIRVDHLSYLVQDVCGCVVFIEDTLYIGQWCPCGVWTYVCAKYGVWMHGDHLRFAWMCGDREDYTWIITDTTHYNMCRDQYRHYGTDRYSTILWLHDGLG